MSIPCCPDLADVRAVAEQVWSSFLGDEDPLLPLFATGPAEAPRWSAAVSVTGGWSGTVTVELDEEIAQAITAAMLGLDGPADEADVVDAVGELANMIGGNIKSLMPGPSVLTLPVVETGHVAEPSPPGLAEVLEAAWRGHPVRVTVRAAA